MHDENGPNLLLDDPGGDGIHRRRFGESFIVSCVYLLLTAALTFPLCLHMGSRICGDVGDNYAFLWQFRWFSTALTELHVSPFYAPSLNYPAGSSILLNPTTLFNTGLSIPLQRIFPVVTVYNLLILFSFWMAAVAMYLLARHLALSAPASFVAGFVYAFSSYHFAHALGHLTIVSIEWIPLFTLYLLKSLQTRRPAHLAAASLFLVLCALCSWYFLLACGLMVCTTTAFFALPWRRGRSVRTVLSAAAILCLTLAILAPILVPMMLEAAGRPAVAGHAPANYPADLAGFFVPGFTSTFGMLFLPIWTRFRANPIESSTFIGYGVLFLAGLALLKGPRRAVSFWAFTLAVFFTLSLGPFLNVLGRDLRIPLPYLLVQHLVPFASVAGVPARLHVITSLCLSVLCATGVDRLFARARTGLSGMRMWAPAGLCLLLLVDHLHVPVYLSRHTVSPFYEALSRDRGEYALIDFTPRGKALFCQSVHGKGLVRGYVARGLAAQGGAFLHTAAARCLFGGLGRRDPAGEGCACDGVQARSTLERFHVRYLVYPKIASPAEAGEILAAGSRDAASGDMERLLSALSPAGRGAGPPGRAVSRLVREIREREGLPGTVLFALKARAFFASHTESLPYNTISPFVPESERTVRDQWSLPVVYEDGEIRVYSADFGTGSRGFTDPTGGRPNR